MCPDAIRICFQPSHLGETLLELKDGSAYGEVRTGTSEQEQSFLDSDTNSYFKEYCRLWCFKSALRETAERTSLTEVETWAAKAFF